MTFYEAALHVLEREGKPLHVRDIVEIALRENFLSHVGKSPEEVMQSRLLAMAKRKNDRKVVATALQTYGLAEWGLPEDAAALEPPVVEPLGADEPPLRPRERHPVPSSDNIRVAGRLERPRRRREEGEERPQKRRLSPLAELVSELLGTVPKGMPATELASLVREGGPLFEDLGAEALVHGLREENRKRQENGRRPLFDIDADQNIRLDRVALERGGGGETIPEGAALHTLVPLEAAREERTGGMARLLAQAADHRRFVTRQIRRRLSELDPVGFERATVALLEATGYRDPRLVRRAKDGVLILVRRREGVVDWKTLVRAVRGSSEIARDELDQLRRDVKEQGAHLGLFMSAGEASRELRNEAQAATSPLVMVMTGDALAERFMEKRLGSTATSIEAFDLDEDFFRRCRDKVAPTSPPTGRERDRDRKEKQRRSAASPSAPATEVVPATEPAPMAASVPGEPALTPEFLERRRDEARLRMAAHERIEAAEEATRAQGRE